jgi:hypothetical protein
MNPKAIGMGSGSWEVQCVACWRFLCGGVSGYDTRTAPAYRRLSELRRQFVDTGDLTTVKAEVVALAHDYDTAISKRQCECGGLFSIAAMPRCPSCSAVAFESYFHYVFRPDTRRAA